MVEKRKKVDRVMITVRMTEEERGLVKEAAWWKRMNLNEYCRTVLVERSKGVVRDKWWGD